MAALGERLDKVNERLDRTDERLDRTDERLDRTDEHLDAVDHHMNVFKDQFVAAANACVEGVNNTNRLYTGSIRDATSEMTADISNTAKTVTKEAAENVGKLTKDYLTGPVKDLEKEVNKAVFTINDFTNRVHVRSRIEDILLWANPVISLLTLAALVILIVF